MPPPPARAALVRWRRAAFSSARALSSASSAPSPETISRGTRTQPATVSNAQLIDALRCFHAQHQHFIVPYNFRVPLATGGGDSSDDTGSTSSPQWPEHMRGLRLGRALRRLVRELQRENGGASTGSAARAAEVAQLRALGFPLATDWPRFQWEQMALSALRAFKAAEGHLRVPRRFVVPEGDEIAWPRAAWGYKLGAHVNQLRARSEKLADYQLEALEEIGFVWNVTDDKWESLFLPALRRFHELRGHANVPQRFVVPCDDPEWPHEQLWGFHLGRMVNHIRSGELYYPQLERFLPELNALGFSFNIIESMWDEKIMPSLEVFFDVHGHCNVDKYFEVPHEAPWPQKAWGAKLGSIVCNVRARGDFFQLVGRDMERLEHLGFVWNPSEAKWRQRILPSLETFVLVHGHASIERGFVVPSKEPWPTRAWGLDLGRIASDAVYRRKFVDFIEIERGRLEALGFFWSDGDSDGGDLDDDSEDTGDDSDESDSDGE